MTNLQAALGIGQLITLDEKIKRKDALEKLIML